MTAQPKRGTLEVYRVAVCKNCGRRVVQDHNTSFQWLHDDDNMPWCEKKKEA